MNIKTIFDSLRAPFFTAVIVPVILGSVIAWHHGADFQWGLFLMAMIGALALHAGANTINDYFDHYNRNDELNVEFIRPFTGAIFDEVVPHHSGLDPESRDVGL